MAEMTLAPESALLARRISVLIERSSIDTTTELSAQQRIAEVLRADGHDPRAEVALNRRDRIDLLCGRVGIEVKIRGGNRREILRQLERYSESDEIDALVLASGGTWPPQIDQVRGKRLLFASLVKGWL